MFVVIQRARARWLETKIGQTEFIQVVLREWLETNSYLLIRTINEESQTDGGA